MKLQFTFRALNSSPRFVNKVFAVMRNDETFSRHQFLSCIRHKRMHSSWALRERAARDEPARLVLLPFREERKAN